MNNKSINNVLNIGDRVWINEEKTKNEKLRFRLGNIENIIEGNGYLVRSDNGQRFCWTFQEIVSVRETSWFIKLISFLFVIYNLFFENQEKYLYERLSSLRRNILLNFGKITYQDKKLLLNKKYYFLERSFKDYHALISEIENIVTDLFKENKNRESDKWF